MQVRGVKADAALAKVFNRVPTYDELAREEYLQPQKIAPGIRREYTRFVQSPFFIRGFNDGVQKESLLDEVSSMQHLGGGLPTLPSTGGGGGGGGGGGMGKGKGTGTTKRRCTGIRRAL